MPRRTAGAAKGQQAGRTGLGRAIEHDCRKRAELPPEPRGERATGVSAGQAARSVLEQSPLEDFLAQAALSRANFEAARGERFEEEGPTLVSAPGAAGATPEAARAAASLVVPIPWRPQWRAGSSPEELQICEGEAFLQWRRGLARLEEQEGVVMTPYERNLDFWRQLWRCVERCDLLVQIVDSRDPMFYRCQDLERYVKTRFGTKKRLLLLMNKSDFLSPELRRRWAAHLAAAGVDAVFFSALRELHRQRRLPPAGDAGGAGGGPAVGPADAAEDGEEGTEAAPPAVAEGEEQEQPPQQLPPHGPLDSHDDDPDVADSAQLLEELRARLPAAALEGGSGDVARRGVVGFVGYPNVGKSSVINALFGAKKVSMSRTPGKTKHLQTLEIPGADLTLCDCPGLVFPSVVATKAHLAINGTVPVVELRDYIQPVRLIVEKVGMDKLVEKYALSEATLQSGEVRLGQVADPARRLLAGLALARQHFLRLGVPDETWAARKVLREFTSGELLHCEPPPDGSGEGPAAPPLASAADEAPAAVPAEAAAAEEGVGPEGGAEADGSDFSDLDAFLRGEAPRRAAGPPSRREVRKVASRRKRREQQ